MREYRQFLLRRTMEMNYTILNMLHEEGLFPIPLQENPKNLNPAVLALVNVNFIDEGINQSCAVFDVGYIAVFEFLKENGNPVEMHSYDMQHNVCIEELKALGEWMGKMLCFF